MWQKVILYTMRSFFVVGVCVVIGGIAWMAYRILDQSESVVVDGMSIDIAGYRKQVILLGGVDFDLYIADTSIARQRGLSGTRPLTHTQGLLFVFQVDDLHGFWMKDMLYAIDMVWLDAHGRVVSIHTDIAPSTYPTVFYPDADSRYVLELMAGGAQHLNIEVGDSIPQLVL